MIVDFVAGGPKGVPAHIIRKSVNLQDSVIGGDVFKRDTVPPLAYEGSHKGNGDYSACQPSLAILLVRGLNLSL